MKGYYIWLTYSPFYTKSEYSGTSLSIVPLDCTLRWDSHYLTKRLDPRSTRVRQREVKRDKKRQREREKYINTHIHIYIFMYIHKHIYIYICLYFNNNVLTIIVKFFITFSKESWKFSYNIPKKRFFVEFFKHRWYRLLNKLWCLVFQNLFHQGKGDLVKLKSFFLF